MQRISEIERRRGPLDRRKRGRCGIGVLLLALLAASPAGGQQGHRLPARQPSYPAPARTPASRSTSSDGPTSAIDSVKQTLSSLSRPFRESAPAKSSNAAGRRRVSSPRRLTGDADTSPSRRPDVDEKSQIGTNETRLAAMASAQLRPHMRRDEITRGQHPHALLPSSSKRGFDQPGATRASRPIFNPSDREPAHPRGSAGPLVNNGAITNRVPSVAQNQAAVDDAPIDLSFLFANEERQVELISASEPQNAFDARLPLPTPPAGGEAPSGQFAPLPHTIDVPLNGPAADGRMNISSRNGRISLIVRDAPLEAVLDLIAQQHGLNIVTAGPAAVSVSATLTNVSLDDAMSSILSVAGYTWMRQKDIVIVSAVSSDRGIAPSVQGRVVRVFALNFVSAIDVEKTVAGLLSPVGKVFVTEANPVDKRRTRELLVVEDLPDYLGRVEGYVAQVDQPPRQVLIEAHVLRVDLSDETRHGIDFQYVARLADARISLRTQGFANPAASPAFFLGIDGTDLGAFIEAIKITSDAKTLASPKVLVINGQNARIQIGERFGYLVTTTTETSTLQNVDFLDVGVVLEVTPQISDDNQVLMTVQPKVSSGRIDPATGLPEEETTEVQTTVMLPDGHGIVIGGLIQETDTDRQSKIPIVGDLWLVGKLFQRRLLLRERSEIVIALVPRIVPYGIDYDMQAEADFARATTPLLHGPLWKTDRPWEPVLPDAERNPRRLNLHRVPHAVPNLFEPTPYPPEYYFPTRPELDFSFPRRLPHEDEFFIEVEPLHPVDD